MSCFLTWRGRIEYCEGGNTPWLDTKLLEKALVTFWINSSSLLAVKSSQDCGKICCEFMVVFLPFHPPDETVLVNEELNAVLNCFGDGSYHQSAIKEKTVFCPASAY